MILLSYQGYILPYKIQREIYSLAWIDTFKYHFFWTIRKLEVQKENIRNGMIEEMANKKLIFSPKIFCKLAKVQFLMLAIHISDLFLFLWLA